MGGAGIDGVGRTGARPEPAFLRLDPNATRHVLAGGTVVTPSSSIPQPQPGPGAAFAHTNVHLFQPLGMPPITNRSVRPAAGPPYPGFNFETPESIACIYRFVSAVPGCNPNTVTAVPKGGSRTIAPKGELEVTLKPDNQEITFNCDIHKWMDAYARVFDHPYATVTKEDGTYEIKHVPTGADLQIVAWHEKAGYLDGGSKGVIKKLNDGENTQNFTAKK